MPSVFFGVNESEVSEAVQVDEAPVLGAAALLTGGAYEQVSPNLYRRNEGPKWSRTAVLDGFTTLEVVFIQQLVAERKSATKRV
jgi:hypothetical protein